MGPEFWLEVSSALPDLGTQGFLLPSGNCLSVAWMPYSLGHEAEFMLIFVQRPDSQAWLGKTPELYLPAAAALQQGAEGRVLAPRELTFLKTGLLYLPSGYPKNTLSRVNEAGRMSPVSSKRKLL